MEDNGLGVMLLALFAIACCAVPLLLAAGGVGVIAGLFQGQAPLIVLGVIVLAGGLYLFFHKRV